MDHIHNWSGLDEAAKRSRKGRWLERLIDALDAQFPGFAAAVVQREMSTAETMQHYLNTPSGGVYGFAPVGSLREMLGSTPRTSIDGLLLASAFTSSGGFSGAMLGGAEAARVALAEV